ncbi:NINE protein [Pseudonocardia sp. HH130630-07]|uniref:NINE protein n=1 Tax=Pseudonocardia sp. HH130630-07 TaxID=1690815 RepID=UPI0008152523|nr:NINE protein [Pseudonocardia sp. HH130630-07]ANY08805.1 hypothetical protein AFB00_23890 [Pseudonocardia sp. HH130630-07]
MGAIDHDEQEEAVRALTRHRTDGRLSADALADRVRRARSATSHAELAELFSDLPEPHPGGAVAGAGTDPEATTRLPTPATPDPTLATPAETDPSGHPAAGPYGDDTTPTDHLTRPAPGHEPTSTGGAAHGPGTTGGDRDVPWYGAPGAAGYGAYAAGPGYGGPGGYPHSGSAEGGYPGPGFAPGTGHQGAGHGPAYPPHPSPPVYGPYGGVDPYAPFGREMYSGRPYSERQKVVAGLLQLFLPIGIGRFYTGHTDLAIAQLLVTIVTFGFGFLWSFIDGIVILAGNPTDPEGRPLRP